MASVRDRFLAHAEQQLYDPAARRERYLKERQLKGRQPAAPDQAFTTPGSKNQAFTNGSSSSSSSPAGKPSSSADPITPKRVAAMKARLETLKALLTKLTEEANKKAGVDTTDSKSAEKSKTTESKKPDKPKTAAEKKDAAKKAKEARAKDPKTSETVQSLQTELNAVHDKIAAMRARIAALNKQKAAAPKKPSAAPSKTPSSAIVPKSKVDEKPSGTTAPSTAGKGKSQNGR